MGVLANGGDNTVDTELPDAAALSDAVVNPTTSQVGAAVEVFSGTTWQRQRAMSAVGEASAWPWPPHLRRSGSPQRSAPPGRPPR